MFRNIEMENSAVAVLDDEETIQDPEGESRHSEEVHGRDDFAVIAQKRRPELAFLVGRRQATEIAGNGTLRNIEAELDKLSVDPRSAPRGILFHHAPNETSNLGINSGPAGILYT